MSEEIRDTCRGFYQVLSDYLDGTLTPEDAAYVQAHIGGCPPCGVYLEQFRVVYRATGKVEAADLPEDFCRVMERVLGRWKCGD
jgi:anti-sigma factor RsiW